jgi:hypothetical protein
VEIRLCQAVAKTVPGLGIVAVETTVPVRLNRQFTRFHAEMWAEEQSRLLANPTADAKVSAAATQWRLSNPDGCATPGGNKANCY